MPGSSAGWSPNGSRGGRGCPCRRLESSGTENAMFRLGADKVVRLPRHPRAVESIEHELRWLPRLGPALPAAAPEPLGRGEPGPGSPWPWSVYRWLDGGNPVPGALDAPEALARDLASYVRSLRRVDASDGPAGRRGVPLAARDPSVREAHAQLAGRVDTAAVTHRWEEALRAPAHSGPPVWAHGDLMAGNLLVTAGRRVGAWPVRPAPRFRRSVTRPRRPSPGRRCRTCPWP